jgi:UDP-sugar diphosphatase
MGASAPPAAAAPVDAYPHGLAPLARPGVTMSEALARLGPPASVAVTPLTAPSNFVSPLAITFPLDGRPRRWDAVKSHASVAVLLHHAGLDAFILVRQFRPAVYVAARRAAAEAGAPAPPMAAGFVLELVAGICDKPDLSLAGIAREEVLEEAGFDVPLERVRRVTSFVSAVGISGARQTVFAAEVDDWMLVAPGAGAGGLAEHGEAIEVLALPVAALDAFLLDDGVAKSSGAMFALQWGSAQLQRNDGRLFAA